MNCDQARATYLVGDDDAPTQAHLTDCPACRSVRDNLDEVRHQLSESSIWEEPSPELEDQVVALVSGRRTTGPAVPLRVPKWLKPAAVAAAGVAAAVVMFIAIGSPSPDWVVSMPGTDLAAQASSTVSGWNTDSGTRMLLSIEGLDPAPAGFVYEFWLSEGPLHISAGTFKGAGEIELWAGVTRADFPRLWVTLEPIDEDESPSGRTVLDTGDA